MSMLAEPRRKQKIINLRAKNNAWSNDTNKFGQRMLEKMGWSAGKGLGVKENGIVEHVIAKYKNDDKGLGYQDKNDQWTKHEDDFNALLANLSSDKDEKKEVLHSGVSLEVKSKKSKARIHYHKFTRGKDLSRYSEKDLANIFGKKSFKEDCTRVADKEEIESTEKVFTEKGSMEDYFKSKMAALQSKIKSSDIQSDQSINDSDYLFQGFSTQEDGKNTLDTNEIFSFYSNSNKCNDNVIQEVEDENFTKKKKKKKTEKKICDQVNEMEDFIPSNNKSDILFPPCKAQKHKLCDTENISTDVEGNKKKSKKKNKNAESVLDSDEMPAESMVKDDKVPRKKKKKNKEL